MPADTTVIVFCKAPVAGYTKTRLIPRLGAEGAASLHAKLIERTVATAVAAALGPVELWCTPSPAHPLFQTLATRYRLVTRTQPEGDLGVKMHRALDQALSATRYALLIGTDCPTYSAGYLDAARAALAAGDDAVLGPATDGGYVLIGLARNDMELFSDIAWGGASVLAATREQLRKLQWRYSELETLSDIDRPEDVDRGTGIEDKYPLPPEGEG